MPLDINLVAIFTAPVLPAIVFGYLTIDRGLLFAFTIVVYLAGVYALLSYRMRSSKGLAEE